MLTRLTKLDQENDQRMMMLQMGELISRESSRCRDSEVKVSTGELERLMGCEISLP